MSPHPTKRPALLTPLTVSSSNVLVDGQDAAFRELLGDLFAFSQALQEARERFARFIELSPAQYMILIAIDRSDSANDAGINQIAQRLHYSGAFVTIEVNALVKANYVKKVAHPTDGRRVLLSLTDLGRTKLAALADFQRPVNDALFAPLDSQKFETLRTIMRELADNSDRALKLAGYLEQTLPDQGEFGQRSAK